jgi:hypothetical protein
MFQRIAAIARQAAAITAVVLGAIPGLHLPLAVQVPLITIGGLLLVVEHFLSDPSTGNAPAKAARK